MSVFKCKMCGGELDIIEGSTIAKCLYCKTKQTIPNVMDENMQNLFNRANVLRMKGEFDKAERIYEKIVQSDDTQSEAYWGIILCKYGIEYVDDPNTNEKIPTCHRASYDSIIADEDYKSAIENADSMQKGIYENQAKEIDRIQKEILALAQKEETYDVFICYKETDSNGRRTQDSVIANDIYYQLKDAGFKVFYAAITLEGKLGSAYEPIIFAALNSAKAMLVIGTNPDYFNAVWVKNEWSRYLKIIQKDRSKLLIPCYRDMDAYELPEEFAHLQAQDMSKIGFINDVVRGIKKVVNKVEAPKVVEAPKTQNNTFDALIKRIYLLLEDGEFDKADELCEQVLNGDPENAEAYICKMLIEFKCHTKDELSSLKKSITNSKNYNKVIRFGNDEQIEYVKDVEGNIQVILRKIQEENLKKLEEERKREEELKRKQEDNAKRESSAGLEFELNKDGKSYTLTKVGSCTEKNIVIDMHKSLPITSIGNRAFKNCTNLTSIIISNSIVSIGNEAFECCSNLTSITIPDSVTSIGDWTFNECKNLTDITISNSVTTIGVGAFCDCDKLKIIYCFDNFNKIKGIHNAKLKIGVIKLYYSESEPNKKLFKHYWHYVNGVPTEW